MLLINFGSLPDALKSLISRFWVYCSKSVTGFQSPLICKLIKVKPELIFSGLYLFPST